MYVRSSQGKAVTVQPIWFIAPGPEAERTVRRGFQAAILGQQLWLKIETLAIAQKMGFIT